MSASAWTISRLATAAGDEELAETTWRRANRLESVEAAARLAQFLVEHTDVRVGDAIGAGGGGGPAERSVVWSLAIQCAPRPQAVRSDCADGAHHSGCRQCRPAGRGTATPWRAAAWDGRADDGIAALAEAEHVGPGRRPGAHRQPLPHVLADAKWVFAVGTEHRAAARHHFSTAAQQRVPAHWLLSEKVLAQCLAEGARSADDFAERVRAVDEATAIVLATAGSRGEIASSETGLAPLSRPPVWRHNGDRRTESRFLTACLRCDGAQ